MTGQEHPMFAHLRGVLNRREDKSRPGGRLTFGSGNPTAEPRTEALARKIPENKGHAIANRISFHLRQSIPDHPSFERLANYAQAQIAANDVADLDPERDAKRIQDVVTDIHEERPRFLFELDLEFLVDLHRLLTDYDNRYAGRRDDLPTIDELGSSHPNSIRIIDAAALERSPPEEDDACKCRRQIENMLNRIIPDGEFDGALRQSVVNSYFVFKSKLYRGAHGAIAAGLSKHLAKIADRRKISASEVKIMSSDDAVSIGKLLRARGRTLPPDHSTLLVDQLGSNIAEIALSLKMKGGSTVDDRMRRIVTVHKFKDYWLDHERNYHLKNESAALLRLVYLHPEEGAKHAELAKQLKAMTLAWDLPHGVISTRDLLANAAMRASPISSGKRDPLLGPRLPASPPGAGQGNIQERPEPNARVKRPSTSKILEAMRASLVGKDDPFIPAGRTNLAHKHVDGGQSGEDLRVRLLKQRVSRARSAPKALPVATLKELPGANRRDLEENPAKRVKLDHDKSVPPRRDDRERTKRVR